MDRVSETETYKGDGVLVRQRVGTAAGTTVTGHRTAGRTGRVPGANVPFEYHGEVQDAATGLVYLRA